MFMAANKLYGITFTQNTNLPIYYPGVETYEVKEANGDLLGILYLDYYPRESKSGGAWCTSFRESGHDINGKKIYPVVSLVMNFTPASGDTPALLTWDETETMWHEFGHSLHAVMNFTPASGDTPALLTWDETETMWHEFGHSLHAFFSDGLYSRTCGNVPHDYVEMPSQIMENWVAEPEVIRMYAKHYKTGEPMPDSLIAKIENSALFNQGFMTTELIAASILDMKYHEITSIDEIKNLDVDAFEKQQMDAIGLMPEILPRYATAAPISPTSSTVAIVQVTMPTLGPRFWTRMPSTTSSHRATCSILNWPLRSARTACKNAAMTKEWCNTASSVAKTLTMSLI